jgi:Xaa-Pro aminopeptidase
VILKDENIYYLTGFYGKNSGSILLIAGNSIYFLVNFIYSEHAKKTIKNDSINIVCYKEDKFKKITCILEGYGFKKTGIEGRNISFTDFRKLEKLLSAQGKKIINADGTVEKLRAIKDKSEILKIKKACNITDKAFKTLLDNGARGIAGLTEIKLAFYLEELLTKNGSAGSSFDIIAAYGKNSSLPHHSPGKIKEDRGVILIDFGCRYEQYCSDMTRTIFRGKGKNCNEFRRIYDIVLEAQLRAIQSCREGIKASELDGIARKFISSKGYGKNFGHGLGHGVGLEVHEEPAINSKNKKVLKKNMIITIEPGIYIENFGGVRIEDMVLVGKSSCKVLYKSRKDFLILR